MVLHGNAKTTEEIQLAVEGGAGTVVVDNFDDIDRLEAWCRPARAGLPGTGDTRCAGLDARCPRNGARGFEVRLTSHGWPGRRSPPATQRPAADGRAASRRLPDHGGRRACRSGRTAGAGRFPVYDLGGGLRPVHLRRPPPSLDRYLDVLIDAARAHLPADARILIEPGRSMVASSAVTLYTVTTVKPGTTTFVAVDGGMADNLEVALVGQRFEAIVVNRGRRRPAGHRRRPPL